MRSTSLTHWTLFSAPLLLILAAIWLGFTTEADVAVFFHDHRAVHPTLKTVMQLLTDWSNPLFYAGYGLTLLTAYKSNNRERVRFILILLVVQALVAGLAVHFLKTFIGRPRPGQGQWFDPLSSRGTQHSLPSGHTTEITGWALPLTLRLERIWLTGLFGVFVGLVGFSRIYLGWHHPSDVFFGWMLGSVSGFATVIIANSTLFTGRS
ncbi:MULTISPECIES: phosphatase PAP2 family protein [unclassified Pseudodesulfovibrio]|uniref:phosphatase PAP2 family protein n=1 Tax=unclassified Pseudodesulfovibrio TaxID=2661612 RepID=UPI000FEBE7C6|nr:MULTISPECIES: phosphatase PAP2 family protein [unclassified Pseudodesulfovibrio]MCJ2165832.1 phosphatase PAP2 family protein [Pseudodesulfovibrio sp. S3-i]RWU02739.1 PAP2 family protein [Pseudodesulfovibrio sp. S3]